MCNRRTVGFIEPCLNAPPCTLRSIPFAFWDNFCHPDYPLR
jgi:hypothetical protein